MEAYVAVFQKWIFYCKYLEIEHILYKSTLVADCVKLYSGKNYLPRVYDAARTCAQLLALHTALLIIKVVPMEFYGQLTTIFKID